MNAPSTSKSHISFAASTALGVGGMMGAGLYTLLGLAASRAGSLVPVAFAVGALAASLSVYSYAKLGATFPGRGGSASFVNAAFGRSVMANGVNVFQYFGYLVATSLYAAGFADYAKTVLGSHAPAWTAKVAGVGVVLAFAAVALLDAKLVGKAQAAIVGIELVILAIFIVVGGVKSQPARLTESMPGFVGVLTAAALLYVTYQGFGVIANASGRMAHPARQLPRSMFTALALVAVFYIVISAIVVMVLPLPTLLADSGHALASAAQAVAGSTGLLVMGAAALLATASAVNATLFAATNIGLDEGDEDQLPRRITTPVGRTGSRALVISAAVVCVLVLVFPLDAVGSMTSMAFLLVYGVVSFGHLGLRAKTGARAWPLIAAVAVNAVLFVFLLMDAVKRGPVGAWVTLLVALVVSFVYAKLRQRSRD